MTVAVRALDARDEIARQNLSQSVLMRLSKITVDPAKDRRGDDTDLQDLLESLSDVGLLHPVLVLPADDDGNHELLAGYRRLRAARKLGWEEVSTRIVTFDGIRAELAALAENLVRKVLPRSEELRAMARAKAIYDALHPDARQGGARRASSGQNGHLKPQSFAEYTAKGTGQSARTIRRKVLVGERATARVLAALDDGDISLADAESIVALPSSRQDEEVDGCRNRGGAGVADASMLTTGSPRRRENGLPAVIGKLLSAAELAVSTVRGLAGAMDVATVELCRQSLCRVQKLIAEALSELERAT